MYTCMDVHIILLATIAGIPMIRLLRIFGTDSLRFDTARFKRPLVCQTLKFSNKLSFIKPVEVLQISSKGKQYCDYSTGLCIDIPEGAVPEDSIVQLEIGMCLFGPFKFPGNLNPIAPILMLCPQNDVHLNKNMRVTLPHIIEDAIDSDEEALGIQVVKADHNDLVEGDECVFDTILATGASEISFHCNNGRELITFSLPHFCFITLRAKYSKEVAERAGYCVCPLFPTPKAVTSESGDYCLCVTYFMDPCLEVSL